jgi:inner membrane protein YidH
MTSQKPAAPPAPSNGIGFGPPADKLVRPQRVSETEPPPVPDLDLTQTDLTSVQFSQYRTHLSNHRTGLSEHRTSLSEYRTDLSGYRTDLSTERTEMSMRRTGLSFQRTRMSADRTLMSIIRTALSLIGFGFTIYQFFGHLVQTVAVGFSPHAPRNFGVALVVLGMLMLTLGIAYHVQYMRALRAERAELVREKLIHGDSPYPVSLTLLTAAALWLLGLLAISSMVFNIAPFA